MGTARDKADRLKDFLHAEAIRLGFGDCRVVRPDAIPESEQRLGQFLQAGYHGTMEWMEARASFRANPAALWPDVKSIIMLAMNYGPDQPPLDNLALADRGSISVYARHRDYHDVVKGKLKELAGKLASRTGGNVKVFVDTAPVMEKPLAAASGLGWQGKHTNLVSGDFGSWLLLGSIFSDVELLPDAADVDHCGSCSACLTACPTDAFPAPYKIDARRCISYLTIEHKGAIAREFREKMGNRIYGCDDCLAACPWNKYAQQAREQKLQARDDLRSPELTFLLTLDDAAFRHFFSGSPVKRIGRNRFVRNCLIAVGNSGDRDFIEPCKSLLADDAPEIRAMAVWALERLLGVGGYDIVKHALPHAETDPIVLAELNDWGQVF